MLLPAIQNLVMSFIFSCGIFLVPKGKLIQCFLLPFKQIVPLDSTQGGLLSARGSRGPGPSVFQQTPLHEELLWDKCQVFDLLRKPLYCLLQKCPEAEAASFPS